MIDRETYSHIESLEHDVRGLNDELSDLRRDVERYDDEHRAAVEQLTAQIRALIELTSRLADTLTPAELSTRELSLASRNIKGAAGPERVRPLLAAPSDSPCR